MCTSYIVRVPKTGKLKAGNFAARGTSGIAGACAAAAAADVISSPDRRRLEFRGDTAFVAERQHIYCELFSIRIFLTHVRGSVARTIFLFKYTKKKLKLSLYPYKKKAIKMQNQLSAYIHANIVRR